MSQKNLVFKSFLLTIMFIILVIPYNSYAKNEDLLDGIEKYLNSIKHFQANFIQDNTEDGSLSEGVFYLSRPGKLRVEYTLPSELLLITNNNLTTYYDVELDEITTLKTSSTPIQFLVKDKFSFNEDLKIKDLIINENGNIELSIFEKGKEDKGTISLIFSKSPIVLVGMKVTNELSQVVEIYFTNIKEDIPLNKNLFIFKNPRIYNR